MRFALALIAGGVVGFVAGLRLRPTTESACCARVAAGARDRAGEFCGSACQSFGDRIGIWPHVPAILDRYGF
jgi:hypothetical protein